MANSSMNKDDLAKVLHDATSASFTSSQKLNRSNSRASKKHQSNRLVLTELPQLTSPAMVSEKIVHSGGHDRTLDHIEGSMPNTGKLLFDSAEKLKGLADTTMEDTAKFSDS